MPFSQLRIVIFCLSLSPCLFERDRCILCACKLYNIYIYYYSELYTSIITQSAIPLPPIYKPIDHINMVNQHSNRHPCFVRPVRLVGQYPHYRRGLYFRARALASNVKLANNNTLSSTVS